MWKDRQKRKKKTLYKLYMFIATFPKCGNQTMFEKILQIIYWDYQVDREYLKAKVEWALKQQHELNDQVPMEVPVTEADTELWQQARWYRGSKKCDKFETLNF